MHATDSRYCPVMGFSQHGDKPLGFMKIGYFMASRVSTLKEGSVKIDLVRVPSRNHHTGCCFTTLDILRDAEHHE